MAARRSKTTTTEVPEIELRPFPPIHLPIQPPFPPMEAKLAATIPEGEEWLYEPKWDGFRGLAFRNGSEVVLQSKAGQPLARYFPELVQQLLELPQDKFVLDGEIVIIDKGHLDFNSLLMRIHPAETRIRKLSQQTPTSFLCFDLLVDEAGKPLIDLPLAQRRERLMEFFRKVPAELRIRPSPATRELKTATRWLREPGASGFDGVVAKLLGEPYHSGDRKAMQKIKRMRTADCVIGGFRYASKNAAQVGSLLLGLYDQEGKLNHVGFTSSFKAEERSPLLKKLQPLMKQKEDEPFGFSGGAPGGPSRWSTERSTEWSPLSDHLVCEVQYDHFSGGRFRHGTKFLRWRPEKLPEQCTYEQVMPTGHGELDQLLNAA